MRQFNAHELGFFPFARMGGRACLGDLTCDGEHHGDGMFGGGDHVAKGGVHHDDPLFGRGVAVNIVDTNARAANDL